MMIERTIPAEVVLRYAALGWGEATDEPAREDARPNKPGAELDEQDYVWAKSGLSVPPISTRSHARA